MQSKRFHFAQKTVGGLFYCQNTEKTSMFADKVPTERNLIYGMVEYSVQAIDFHQCGWEFCLMYKYFSLVLP